MLPPTLLGVNPKSTYLSYPAMLALVVRLIDKYQRVILFLANGGDDGIQVERSVWGFIIDLKGPGF